MDIIVCAGICQNVRECSQLLCVQNHTFCLFNRGIFGFFMYVLIQHCFICRPSDSTVSADAGTEPIGQLRLRHWLSEALATRLHLIHILLNSETKSTCPSVSFSIIFLVHGTQVFYSMRCNCETTCRITDSDVTAKHPALIKQIKTL